MVALRTRLDASWRALGGEMMHIPVAESKLQGDEYSDEQAEAEEAAPDARVVPGVKRAAPLQG